MAWRPGPAIGRDINFNDHDERDPWIKRFISRTEDGELSLDVEVNMPLRTSFSTSLEGKESITPHSP